MRYRIALFLALLAVVLSAAPRSFADGEVATFHTDLASWEAVVGTTYILQGTTAADLLAADEVITAPSGETALGGTLTFSAGQFALDTLQPGAEFIYNDHSQNPSFADHLSVGNVNVHEDDDFRLTILGGPAVYALAIEVGENEPGDSGETLKVYGTAGVLLGTLNDPLSPIGGSACFGIVSTEPIGWIEFDEHPGGDDMWIGDIRISDYTPTLLVDIDVKPGSDPNSINLGSNGVVPVAILSSADFDATDVDPSTVVLAGSGVAVRGKGKLLANTEDVNNDGLLDLIVHVETENLEPDEVLDGIIHLTGETFAGDAIAGTDEVTVIPN